MRVDSGWKLMFCVLLLSFPCTVMAASSGPAVGQASPNLIGRTLLDDQLYRLANDKSQPKVVNFFWVECKPCKKEMPELAEMEKDHPKIKFISVHTREESVQTVEKFIMGLAGAPSNIVLTTGRVQETFKYKGLPHTMVLDKNNVVIANFEGYTPQNTRMLKKLLLELSK